jgi:glycosyltransferase involved in cell wall biosynthesis
MVTRGQPTTAHYEVAFVRSDMNGLVGELEGFGVPVHDLGVTSDYDLTWVLRLRRLLARRHYDIVHAHLPYAAGLGRLAVRTMPPSRRPRFVYTEHSLWPRNTLASRVLGRVTSRLDDASIAVAESNRAALPRGIRRRTRVIVHGIDLAQLEADAKPHASMRAALGIRPDHRVVLTVANLRTQKAYPVLLAAARTMIDAGVPVTFLAAGAGPLEAELRALHDRLGLGDRFRFLGARPDVPALMAASDVLVLASHFECMPVVVMEAFAVGTPVVATSVGDLPLVIESGVNGLLVPPGRADRLSDALRRLLEEPELRLALAANAARSANRFDVRRTNTEVEAVYDELLR